MRHGPSTLAIIIAIMSAPPARADDSSPGVPLPGWRAEPTGSLSAPAAAIVLDGDRASVTLTLVGPTGRLVLTTPRFGWLGEAETYPDRQFPELAVTLDGKPLLIENGFRALAGTWDVTALLSAAHLDPYAVTLTPPYLEPADPPTKALEALEQAGAVRRTDGKSLAAWSVERTVAVEARAGALTTAWRARPAFDELPAVGTGGAPDLAPYCLDASKLSRATGRPAGVGALVAREYAFAASIDGRAPATVSLEVSGLAPDEGRRVLIAACQPDGEPAIGKDWLHAARVRPSRDGFVHVLTVSEPAAHD